MPVEGITSRNSDLPPTLRNPVKHNISTTKQHFIEKLKTRWKEECANSPYAERMEQKNPSLPSRRFVQLVGTLNFSGKAQAGCSGSEQVTSRSTVPTQVYLRGQRAMSCLWPPHRKRTTPHTKDGSSPKRKGSRTRTSAKIIGDGKFAILLAKYIQATGRSEQVEIWRDTKEGSNFP